MSNEITSSINSISINITSIDGKKIDVSKLMLNIEIYEGLFEFFLTGKLIIADTIDLIQHFPLIGNEEMEISIDFNNGSFKKYDFRIYKLTKDVVDNRGDVKRKILVFYFCSKEAIKDSTITFSKKYSGKPEAIISNVLSGIGSTKKLDYERCSNSLEIYSNYWKPSKIIDFVTRQSRSNYLDYVFFETLDGFVFKSVSNLCNQESITDIKYENQSETFIDNNQIKVFKMNSYFDINTNGNIGLFGSTLYKPNDTKYSYTKVASTLKNNVEEIVTNGLSFPYMDELNNSSNLVVANYYDPKISSVRMSSLKLLTNYNMVIKVQGDLNKKVGSILNLIYPNQDNEKTTNASFNGKWLIKGIKHSIQQYNVYEQNIVIVKNALFNNNKLSKISKLRNI